MTGALRLIVFDVDGTLVDSQGDILASMKAAFGLVELPVPSREDVLSIVGLSLNEAMARLVPGADAPTRTRLVEAYKDSYADLRRRGGAASSPLFPGIRNVLDELREHAPLLLGIATGKSRRGLSSLIATHGFDGYFQTTQVADDHPSKPHPSMLHTALAETGVDAKNAVMVGDTSYDMEMANAAGVRAIGVTWGYHPRAHLSDAHSVVSDANELRNALRMWMDMQT